MKITDLPHINQNLNKDHSNYCVSIVASRIAKLTTGQDISFIELGMEADKIDGVIGNGTFPHLPFRILQARGLWTYTIIRPKTLTEWRNFFRNFGYIAIEFVIADFNPNQKDKNLKHMVLGHKINDDGMIEFLNSEGEKWGDNGFGKIHFSKVTTVIVVTVNAKQVKQSPYKYFSEKEVAKWKMNKEVWEKLDQVREMAGIPIIITSGLRTKEENRKAGGKPNSAHLTGEAVDFRCLTGEQRYKFIHAMLSLGITRIGIGKNYLHMDISKTLPQNVIWHYY